MMLRRGINDAMIINDVVMINDAVIQLPKLLKERRLNGRVHLLHDLELHLSLLSLVLLAVQQRGSRMRLLARATLAYGRRPDF